MFTTILFEAAKRSAEESLQIYRPVYTPFVPNNLLYSVWLHATHLAGYEQRDAHEFLITLLTLIHGHLVGEISLQDDDGSNSSSVNGLSKTSSKQAQIQKNALTSSNNNTTSALSGANNSTHSNIPPPPSHVSANSTVSSLPSNMDRSVNMVHHQHPHLNRVVPPPLADTYSQSSCISSRDSSSEACDCIVHQVFFGDLESVISYDGCEHLSSTVDPFLDLSLDVIQSGSTSLQACLTSYFRPEAIDGLLLCAQCNLGRPAVKQFSLLHLPNVLCFYLKRCHHDTKINTSITFPAELDMAPYLHHTVCNQSAWHDRYSLYAVLNHSGETNFGHYTAYIRVCPNGWCLCDDQKVVPVNLNDVLHTDAYVLLYHRNVLSARI